MKILIKGKNVQVTPALREYVEKRIGKITRYFEGELKDATVTLVVEKDMQRVEVSIPLNGYILRGEEETMDMYTSIDNVVDKLERQVRKYKTRMNRKIKNLSIKDLAPETNTVAVKEEVDEPKVVKTKRFAVKPMHVDEAILQMELLGHNFFVFLDANTEEVNVLYKRKDGNYGLIEPDLG
ncbi:MAG: ribosome-associated translation inhibitor RaiA [Clostridia bacterium]|jgi:putative sigma-54 modulation protein|nr:ribosome-associated translation inhibitor RaiA [Clostridia bacterium]